MFLIIGSEEEQHSKHIFDELKKRKYPVSYFDSRKYPLDLRISYLPEPNNGYYVIDNKKVYFKDIKGVYWRWFYGIQPENTSDSYTNQMILRERTTALKSSFECLSCNWLNSHEAIEMHKLKPYQLCLMRNNGIRIPKTLITNDADSLVDFYKKNNKKVIYKPVLGGAMTEILQDSDIKKEKLKSLKTSPVQLQELIEGVDIRIYAIGNKLFPAELSANTIDFRADNNAKPKPVKIPDNVKKDCKKIMKLLKLKYSGIDVKKTKEGEYVFLEANPAPMFIGFEKMTDYPITKSFIDLLVK